jgi:hypothetical protein
MREMGYKLEIINPGHHLLSHVNVFGAVPEGANTVKGTILASARVIYSDSDYGCAWEGGAVNNPLSREIIRSSFEMGVNLCLWCH